MMRVEQVVRRIHRCPTLTKLTRVYPAIPREMMRVEQVVRQIHRCPALTGLGFFSVERRTLTALLSTTITYLIVLLTLNQS
jgi:hypothetical protein